MAKNKPWWITRRHQNRELRMDTQIKTVSTYKEAVSVAQQWYKRHGTEYGIQIHFMVPEIGELVRVRDYYFLNSVEDIV